MAGITAATNRILRFFRRYEHDGVSYTIGNDENGNIEWRFDLVVEAPFRGSAGSVAEAHDAVKKHLQLMKGKR